METVKTFVLLFFAGLLVSLRETKAQQPPPLCASQYALVNYACAFTPNLPSNDRVYLFDQGQNYTQIYSQAQQGHGHSQNHTHRNEHGAHNHRHQQHQGGHNHRQEHEGGHSRGHHSRSGHGRGHHSRHEDEEEHEGGHSRGHHYRSGHGRGHHSRHEDEEEHEGGHRHRPQGSSSRGECCKWLSELDDECVCALLVRLPPFLSRQEHKYTVRVGGSCKVSYKCPGRVRL